MKNWIKAHPALAWMIFTVILSVSLVAIFGNVNSSRCTICGEEATHTFQSYGYCGRHYKDAVNWAIDNVAKKNK